MTLTPGQFSLQSFNPDLLFRAELGPDGANATDGFGGWGITGRPKLEGLTEWGGRNPLAIDIDWMIDNWDTMEPALVEDNIHVLERMAGVHDDTEPPLLVVNGGGAIPFDYTSKPGLLWVVENLTFNKARTLRDSSTRLRVRAGGTISLRKYTFDEALGEFTPAARARRRQKAKARAKARGRVGGGKKKHTVKQGETLGRISATFLGNPDRWREIAILNNLRDPRSLTVGQELRIP